MRLTNRTPEELEHIAGKAIYFLGRLCKACQCRRTLEGMCGYPEQYGDDNEILEKAIPFLNEEGTPLLREIAQVLMKPVDKSPE